MLLNWERFDASSLYVGQSSCNSHIQSNLHKIHNKYKRVINTKKSLLIRKIQRKWFLTLSQAGLRIFKFYLFIYLLLLVTVQSIMELDSNPQVHQQ